MIKKSGDELLNVDPGDTKTMLNKQRVFIGQKCVNLLKDLGLSPTSPQVNWFYEKVNRFHQRVTEKLQGYFKIGLKSKELENIEALGPGNRTKAETPDRIMYLANSFSKVINNIEPGDGMDKVKEEVETYQLDDDQQMLDLNKKLGFDQYWEKVSKITEDDELDTPEDEANTVLEEKTKKFEKLKEEMAKRTSFYKPEQMKNVYETKADKKDKALKEKLDKLKQKTNLESDTNPNVKGKRKGKDSSQSNRKEPESTFTGPKLFTPDPSSIDRTTKIPKRKLGTQLHEFQRKKGREGNEGGGGNMREDHK